MSEESSPRFKLVIFDLDGTLTRERSIWQYIHRQLGKWDGYAEKFREQFLAGEVSYEAFCEQDAQVWKGMSVEAILEIVKEVPFYPGLDELIHHLKEKGLKLAIISSGLSLLSDWVRQRYRFDYSVANELLHENGILTGKVNIRVYYDRKAEWVKEILKQFGIKPEEVIAIGDSRGDLDLFQMSGFSIAFHSSCRELDQLANICIRSENLSDIISILP